MRNKICVFIITLLSLCSGLPAQTQPGKLSGVIIDTNDEEILPGANIYIEALKKGVSADKNGEFLIEAPAGRYSVTFSFMGYHTRKEEITIPNTKGKKLVIRLEPETQSLDEVVITAKSEATARAGHAYVGNQHATTTGDGQQCARCPVENRRCNHP